VQRAPLSAAAEIIILPAISFRPNLFVFARCLSSSFVPFKHDAIPVMRDAEGRGFIGLAPSSCARAHAQMATVLRRSLCQH
jgi:hypothetical protein